MLRLVGWLSAFVVAGVVASVSMPAPPLPQAAVAVHGLRARHAGGQTFLTWREDGVPLFGGSPAVVQVLKARAEIARATGLRFRVYRSARPIVSTRGLTAIADVGPLACWNTDLYGISPQATAKALTYVVEEGRPPLAEGTGLYVTNPPSAAERYYAVTAVVNGGESAIVEGDNSLRAAVRESVGQGEPVLQSVETREMFVYVERPTLRHYVRWEAPPNFSVEGQPFDYLVGVPSRMSKPAPVGLHLHCWDGSVYGGYGWWYDAGQGAMLVASNDVPYDWWTGFHERVMAPQAPNSAAEWRAGVVRPFTQNRLLSFLDWVGTKWEIDRDRTFAAGNSMGASGALMLALHHPERVAWAIGWVPVVRPLYSPQFKASYVKVFGPPEFGARMDSGEAAWDHFDAVTYLQQHPDVETPFITFANGKNDAAVGWKQALDFCRLLQQTRRPHVFVWGQGGHGMRANAPGGHYKESSIDLRVHQSVPAFTRCSLDDDPGDGVPEHGAPAGQINAYLRWDPKAAAETADSWEMTVSLRAEAPQGHCVVDVTPRRLQVLRFRPGDHVRWTNTPRGGGARQQGEVVADQWGLVTLPGIDVGKGGNRVRIQRVAGTRE